MSSPSTNPATTTGSCLCETITYTVTGVPLYTSICHCTNCRKCTSSLFTANSGYAKTQLSILTGQDQLKTYPDNKTTSGLTLMRQFCGNCGSLLFTVSEDRPMMKDIVVVYSGSLDGTHVGGPDGGTWEPQMEVFTTKRAAFLPEFKANVKFEKEVKFDEQGRLLREG